MYIYTYLFKSCTLYWMHTRICLKAPLPYCLPQISQLGLLFYYAYFSLGLWPPVGVFLRDHIFPAPSTPAPSPSPAAPTAYAALSTVDTSIDPESALASFVIEDSESEDEGRETEDEETKKGGHLLPGRKGGLLLPGRRRRKNAEMSARGYEGEEEDTVEVDYYHVILKKAMGQRGKREQRRRGGNCGTEVRMADYVYTCII